MSGTVWVTTSPVDLEATIQQSYVDMVSKLPQTRGWFGLSAQRVKQLPGGILQALSTSSSFFLSFAKAIGEWVQTLLELQQSLFLEPPIPLGNRWVEHVRNTYRDYGLPLPDFSQGATETIEDYETRLKGYAQDLIDLFRRKTLTISAIQESLAKLLPVGTEITMLEPSSLVRPYPNNFLYNAEPLAGETSVDYQTRISVYNDYWKNQKQAGTYVNTLYPAPATTPIVFETLNEGSITDPNSLISKRVSSLKNQLGGYTSLGGTANKRYFGVNNQGGMLEITLGADIPGIYNRLNYLKAAGVLITVFVKQYLGIANNTAPLVGGTLPDPNVLTLTFINLSDFLGLPGAPTPNSGTQLGIQ